MREFQKHRFTVDCNLRSVATWSCFICWASKEGLKCGSSLVGDTSGVTQHEPLKQPIFLGTGNIFHDSQANEMKIKSDYFVVQIK